MASDQMVPVSSKKQQQLEAGKKRLEEFRKKKAAAKKTASTNSSQSANGDLHKTKPPVSQTVQAITDARSDSDSGFNAEKNEKKTLNALEAERDVNSISSFNKPSVSPGPTYSADVKLEHDASYKTIESNRTEENVYSNSNQFTVL